MIKPRECWRAVQARDARRDGDFVYGVTTTGVYCRPSCPARRPLRRNLRFFPDPRAARAAGLRPCLRCRPDEPDDWRALADAAAAGPLPRGLRRRFQRAFGVGPKQFALARRRGRLREELRRQPDATTAIYAAGFDSASRVYADGSAALGMPPGRFRRGGAGERLVYASLATPHGRMTIAASPAGLCYAGFGGRDALRREFPAARLEPGGLRAQVAAVRRLFAGAAWPASLPLDLAGTAWQARVWQALRGIPAGETRSYAGLARQLGNPRAARAVAGACAANRAAVVVPCHRVVRGDGATGGYRWGAGRKRAILSAETAGRKLPK